MRDYCGLVDVFYGNGEVDHFAGKGLASKWFYIKALCGNTIPHATLPFGKMSVQWNGENLIVSLPENTSATLTWKDKQFSLSAGQHTL